MVVSRKVTPKRRGTLGTGAFDAGLGLNGSCGADAGHAGTVHWFELTFLRRRRRHWVQ